MESLDEVNPDVAKLVVDNLVKDNLAKLHGQNDPISRKSKVHLRLLQKLANKVDKERKANFRSRW